MNSIAINIFYVESIETRKYLAIVLESETSPKIGPLHLAGT